MKSRRDTITLVARQIALAQGLSWTKILTSPANLSRMLTYAEDIVATVERNMTDFVWRDGRTKDGRLGQ